MPREFRIVLLVVLVGGLLLVLGVHDLPLLLSARGRCMIGYQPSVLAGFAPGFMTQLACP